MIKGFVGRCAAVCVAFAVAGCNFKESWEGRYGPSPALDPNDVALVVGQQNRIIQTLIDHSGLPASYSGGRKWTYVARAGFNYVDRNCDAYMYALVDLNRRRNEISGILNASETLTTAVLNFTRHRHALQIVAAAFGFGKALNDTIFDSYLFKKNPGVLHGLIKKARQQYRDTIGMDSVVDRPEAIKVIRDYLSICLAQSVENLVLEAVNSASIRSEKPSGETARKNDTNITPTARPDPGFSTINLDGGG